MTRISSQRQIFHKLLTVVLLFAASLSILQALRLLLLILDFGDCQRLHRVVRLFISLIVFRDAQVGHHRSVSIVQSAA